MGKCIRNIALSVIAAVFGILALSGPVFAAPDTNNTNPDTSTTTTPETETTPDNTTDTTKNNTTNTTENTANTTATTEETPSCYDQVGSLGWIICPGAGLFGNVIDGAYNLLTSIIEVNPLPTDNSSPVYIVWKYFRDITNTIFVIFFLIVIFSQLTGVGINNYGIKRVLPRIIVAAILVNLSYIVCTIAVDLSNILGNSLQGFFVNIQNIAIQNGTISDAASNASVSGIVAAMLGVGTAAGIGLIAVSALGGISGVIWVLLPILLAGIVAVISAIITMAARQALIFLLVMVSPLAFIAYMLPNTEKWFISWYRTIFRMLIFYPMFSVLYGASQLAGLVIITSATNWLGVVLGIAVKIIPLVMSIPLMRMSGTILNKVDGLVRRGVNPAQGALMRYSATQQANARRKYLSNTRSISPSARLARKIETNRVHREKMAKEYDAFNADYYDAASLKKRYNGRGKINKYGLRVYQMEQERMDLEATKMNILSDFDEGFKADGTDARVRKRDIKKVERINRGYDRAIVDNAAASARQRSVILSNIEHRADLIRENVKDQSSYIHQRVLESFNVDVADYDRLENKKNAYDEALRLHNEHKALTAAQSAALAAGPLTASEKARYDSGYKAIGNTLADAIADKRKVDREAQSNYFELLDDTPAGPEPNNALINSINSNNYNQMIAAISVMSKRGDHGDIIEILQKNTKAIAGDDPKSIRMQKELNDACLALKGEDPLLWAYGKANMIRRGKYNHAIAKGNDPHFMPFIDYDHFVNSANDEGYSLAEGDRFNAADEKDVETLHMINMHDILSGVKDGKLFAGADRTVYGYLYRAGKDGNINLENYIMTDLKHLRKSACSGMMDGEQLALFNTYLSFGFKQGKRLDEQDAFFINNREKVHKTMVDFFKGMTAGELASVKTATLQQFNAVLLALNNDATNAGSGGDNISDELYTILKDKIAALNKPNMSSQRNSMNETVRKMLGIEI
jgi:hypothetical protein